MPGKFSGVRHNPNALDGSRFLEWPRSERTDHRRAYLHHFLISELFQHHLESRIRFTNTLGILNNGFAISEQTRYSKRHSDAMIAKARHARPAQGCRAVNFEAVMHFSDLCAHRP